MGDAPDAVTIVSSCRLTAGSGAISRSRIPPSYAARAFAMPSDRRGGCPERRMPARIAATALSMVE
jgi:hypothetical protein